MVSCRPVYSNLSDWLGFANEARIVWKLTESRAITMANAMTPLSVRG